MELRRLVGRLEAHAHECIPAAAQYVPMRGQLVNSIHVRADGKFREERRVPSAAEAARAQQARFAGDPDLDDDPIDILW